MNQQRVIIDTDNLRITLEEGTTETAIVVFAGIGFGLGGIQKNEFSRTMRDQNESHSVFYIIDKNRSWYNHTYVEILDTVNPILRNFDSVATLGNSMGGFGALYFSGLFPRCRRAIAFVPQFSVMPNVPEPRWKEWRSTIKEWPITNALENITTSSPVVIVFGADDRHDHWHIKKMCVHLQFPHGIFILKRRKHDAAIALKSRNILSSFIANAIIGAEIKGLRSVLTEGGVEFLEAGDFFP